jgi:hypothetical protein
MDQLAAFIADCCEARPHHRAYASDLYKSYKLWCEETGERRETQTKFGRRLTEKGYENGGKGGARGAALRLGLILNEEWDARIKGHSVLPLTGLKPEVCRGSDRSDIESYINAGEKESHRVIHKKGSDRSEGSGTLSVEHILEELGSDGSGAQKTAKTYLAGKTTLEYVVKAVLFANGMDTGGWERCAPVVEKALGTWEGTI